MNESAKNKTPYFYREKAGCVVLVTEEFEEFGEPQKINNHLSEKTALRLLDELKKALESK